jgi:hypothetical protein
LSGSLGDDMIIFISNNLLGVVVTGLLVRVDSRRDNTVSITGNTVSITDHVSDESCRTCNSLLAAGVSLKVRVSCSAVMFRGDCDVSERP